MGMGKSCKIRHIVRLRQMLRRWRHRAASRSSAPPDVPAGHVAVCVGSSSRRFVVRASHLNHPAFRKLLLQAEEEHGFSHPGPLSLPCDESLFEHILRHITTSTSSSLLPNLDDLQNSLCCCHARNTWQYATDSLPLLQTDKSVW